MDDFDASQLYYADIASAFIRGRLDLPAGTPPRDLFKAAAAAELRTHKFKRTMLLPRIEKVIGILRGLAPTSLLDVGSGRGVFLWPLLDCFPDLQVVAIDRDLLRARDLGAIRRGGIDRLAAAAMDVEALALADCSVDGVTVLEVLEHLREPERAAREVLRVARRFVVASVPSRPDDNPQHIQLFTRDRLVRLLSDAGARRVSVDHVLNHTIAVALV